jgi:hypothetical protein
MKVSKEAVREVLDRADVFAEYQTGEFDSGVAYGLRKALIMLGLLPAPIKSREDFPEGTPIIVIK